MVVVGPKEDPKGKILRRRRPIEDIEKKKRFKIF
jgi:hypothetical protein